MRVKEFNEGLNLLKVHKPAIKPKPKPTLLHKMMSEMFRSVLDEDSSAGVALRGSPYADHLIQVIHKKLPISHKLRWEERQKINWTDIQSIEPNFVLVAGTTGTAAIRWDGNTFEAYIADKDGIQTEGEYPSGIYRLMETVKDVIGTPTKFFVPKQAEGTRQNYGSLYSVTGEKLPSQVKREREVRKKVPPGLATADNKLSTLLRPGIGLDNLNSSMMRKKLNPLIKKYIKTALVDVKNNATTAIKNNAFNIASNKLEHASRLHRILSGLDDPDQNMKYEEDLNVKISNAIIMAARDEYPDKTGSVSKMSGGRFRSEYVEGPDQIVKDIANGDDKKLGTVLLHIKQLLLHSFH